MTGRWLFSLALTLLALSVAEPPASAWNAAGHMTTAAIAYRQLPPATRARVDELLSHHPAASDWDDDHARYQSALEPGVYRFLRASSWPDEIKRKRGWPNRSAWHFANFPLEGSTSAMAPDPGARHDILVGLADNEATLVSAVNAPEERAIALSWVIHLVGDLHQPLHCATAVTPMHPGHKGDEGGNETKLRIEGRKTVKLHAFWDGMMGKSKNPTDALHKAILLEHELGRVDTSGTEAQWVRESWKLAATVAYPVATWTARTEEPLAVDESYVKTAKATGERQMIVGGARLAAVLARVVR